MKAKMLVECYAVVYGICDDPVEVYFFEKNDARNYVAKYNRVMQRYRLLADQLKDDALTHELVNGLSDHAFLRSFVKKIEVY